MIKKRVLSIVFLMFLLLLVMVSMVSADKYTVINSKDWKDVYLGTIYAKYTDSRPVFFKSLVDSQLKTKMMSLDDEIMVFESTSKPVIKKYDTLLKVNGYTNFESLTYSNYGFLQKYLSSTLNPDGYFIMDSDFGMNAIASSTFILKNNYFPLFIDEQTVDSVLKIVGNKPTYLVGRTPVRIVDKFNGIKIQGFPHETLKKTTKLSIDAVDSDWGAIMRVDTVDLNILTKGLPIFVFHAQEYLDELAETIKETNISKFEVIGAGTADIAKAIELKTQKNLNFMLKYGRKITNYPGLEDNILDIDSLAFNYPKEKLKIIKSVHYPEMGILTLTFENTGNVGVLFFSNAEFANEPLSDENTHFIEPGQTKTIPFLLPEKGLEGEEVKVTTRYGLSLPLKFSISGDPGNLFYRSDVETNYSLQKLYDLEILSSKFDTDKGLLEIVIKNPYDTSLELFSELLIGDSDVASSSLITIGPNEKKSLFIKTPYLRDEDIVSKQFNLVTYTGINETLERMVTSVLIKEKKSNLTKISVAVIVVLALVAILFLLLGARKKRKKDKHIKNKKRSTKKKAVMKKKKTIVRNKKIKSLKK